MTWATTDLFLKKLNRVYICIVILIILVIHTTYNKSYRAIEPYSSQESNQEDNDYSQPITFSSSELIEDTNSRPPKGVLVPMHDGYGLGNQLFFYSISYALSRNLRIPLLLPRPPENNVNQLKNFTDRHFVLDHFSLPKGLYVDRTGINQVYSVTCQMAQDISLIPQNILNHTNYFKIGTFSFDGQFFEKYDNELKQIKVKVESPTEGYLKWKDVIFGSEWPIAVHVRKLDIEKQYWSAPVEYFREALRKMKLISLHSLEKKVFVFSDDIKWAREAIFGEGFFPAELQWPIYFVSGSFGGLTNVEELDLMIKCKSIVISNSTFSWWAAYLMRNTRDHKKIVIRPQFNATKHRDDPLGWNNETRYEYAIGYPRDWIAIDT